LNFRPLPYQFRDSPSSETSTSPWLVAAVSPVGWLRVGVAVTAAVSTLIDPLPSASHPAAGHSTASGPKTSAKMAFHLGRHESEYWHSASLPLDDGLRLVNVCHLPMVS
jgi:hypothetical protein